MRRRSFFNGTWSWLLYYLCFLAFIHAKRVSRFEDFGRKMWGPRFYEKCRNPKKCVVLSWASFWMKLSIAPARVGLGITTYLSIKTLANSFQDGMPRVAYLKVSCFVTAHFRPFISESEIFWHDFWRLIFPRWLVVFLGVGYLDDWMWHIHLCGFSWIYNGAIPLTEKYTKPEM